VNVLTATSMFPNPANPLRGISVWQRTAALARRCTVKVIAPSMDGPVSVRRERDGVEIVHPTWIRIPKMVFVNGRLFAWLAGRAMGNLGDFKPDVVDAHFLYPDGYGAVRLARKLGAPVCVTARGTDVNDLCFRRVSRRQVRSVLRDADQLIAVSEALKTRMVEAGAEPERVAVIANGVDTSLFHPDDGARERLGIPADERLLFSAGALIETKGFCELLDAVSRVPETRLVIAGTSPLEGRLREQAARRGIADRVTFLGRLVPEDMVDWYRAADLFCLASWREGCPNVVIEAMACGAPVVASRVGGIPELVADEGLGMLFESRSAEAAAEAIAQALERSWDRDAIARRGAARSWDHVAGEVMAVFEQLLGRV